MHDRVIEGIGSGLSIYTEQFLWFISHTLPSDIQKRYVKRTTVSAFAVINPLIYDTRLGWCIPGTVIFTYPGRDISRAGRDAYDDNLEICVITIVARSASSNAIFCCSCGSAKTIRSRCAVSGSRLYALFSLSLSFSFLFYTGECAMYSPSPPHITVIISDPFERHADNEEYRPPAV